MKKSIYSLLLLVAALTVTLIYAPSNGTAFADDGNYSVVSPDLKSYMYLDTPEMVAICGETVAVYDSGLNKIFVSGTSAKEYDVDFLDDNESIVDMVCAGDVYILTNRTRLYDLTVGQFVNLKGYDVTMMTADNGKLYLYNGLRTAYLLDGENITPFPDEERLIMGATSFAVVDDIAYFYKEGKIYRLPLALNSSATVFAEITANKIFPFIGSVIAVTDTGLTIIYTDSRENMTYTFSEAFPNVNDIKYIAADRTNIAVLSESDRAAFRYSNTFNFIESYGCASNAIGWYNNPTKITALGDNGVAVWDKGNSRLNRYSQSQNFHEYMNYTAMPFTGFACDDYYTFYTDGSTIYMSDTNADKVESFQSVKTDFDISAMCVNNERLYVYDKLTGGVYYGEYYHYQPESITAGEPFKAADFVFKPLFVSYNRIYDMKAAGGDNPVIYANTGSKIEMFSSIGKLNLSIDLGGNFSCFDVDAVGNVYAVSNSATSSYITKYTRGAGGFSMGTPILLSGSFPIEGINSIVLLDSAGNGAADSVYAIDNKKNLLLKIKLDYTRTEEYAPPAAIDTSAYDGAISYAKSKGTVLYAYPDSYNKITATAATGDIFAVLDGHSSDELLFTMTADGKFGYVAKADTIAASPLLSDGTVVALFDTVNLYKLPSANASKTVFDKTQIFTLIDDCADFGGGTAWYKVSYQAGGNTCYGYLLKTRVMSYTVVPEIDEPVYAKAKSVRLGAKVNVYAMADSTSAVITSVTDGVKLKLLEDYSENREFTLVEYNGAIGYVLTSEMQLTKGLTGGQIAAIVLASATLVITAIYLVISRRNKKLNSN